MTMRTVSCPDAIDTTTTDLKEVVGHNETCEDGLHESSERSRPACVENDARNRSSSMSSTGSFGVIQALVHRGRTLEARTHSAAEPRGDPKYCLHEFWKTKTVSRGLIKVTYTFQWLPKTGTKQRLKCWLLGDCTVAKYSFVMEKSRGTNFGGNPLVSFPEFQEFHTLVEECGPSRAGVSWRDAMILTSVAKAQADVIASGASRSTRHDTHSMRGKIWTGKGLARYPRVEHDDDW